jgi:polyribonucleotide nucleotidyltransferase
MEEAGQEVNLEDFKRPAPRGGDRGDRGGRNDRGGRRDNRGGRGRR